jgi:hypothetical protein
MGRESRANESEDTTPLGYMWRRVRRRWRLASLIAAFVGVCYLLDVAGKGVDGWQKLMRWLNPPADVQPTESQVATQPEDNEGIVVSVILPDETFFPPTFRIKSEAREIQDGNVWCYYNELLTFWGDQARDNFYEPWPRRFSRLQPQVGWVDYECTVPLQADPQDITSAKVTLDMDIAIVGRVGRYFAIRTFRLDKDRIGMPTWVLVESQTGPAEKRPPSVLDEVRKGIPPAKKDSIP